MLCRLGLELPCGDARQKREVDIHDVLPADVVTELPDRLEVGERLDVADCAADLDHDDLGLLLACDAMDPLLDLIRDVRNHLHGRAEVIAAPLLRDDGVVDLACGEVRRARDVAVDEALVVPEVEIGLGTVLRHEDLAVLVRGHRPWVDVEVGVHLERGDRETSRCEDASQGSCGDALAKRGGDPSGHEHELRHEVDLRGFFYVTPLGRAEEDTRGSKFVHSMGNGRLFNTTSRGRSWPVCGG